MITEAIPATNLLPADENARLIALRRDLHTHPELAFQEHRTSRIVTERLQAAGLEVSVGVGAPTALVATLRGTNSVAQPRTVLLRADMDALPILEATDLPFASTEAGKMHACGHDGHTAVMVTVAERLAARRAEFGGTLAFAFQPAEEIGEGAMKMVEAGVLTGVDAVLGLHLFSTVTAQHVAVSPGSVFAATNFFTLTVTGRGGHGAMPHETIDSVLAAAEIVCAVQRIVSREISPLVPAVVTIGSIQGGSAPNIIPNEVVLRGTVRTFDQALHARILQRIEEIAAATAAAAGATVHMETASFMTPVVNDETVAEIVRATATTVVGAERVIAQKPTMGGDDVGAFLQRVPGCYFVVGAQRADRPLRPHHHPEFDVDEEALAVGVRVLEESALRLLGSGAL